MSDPDTSGPATENNLNKRFENAESALMCDSATPLFSVARKKFKN